MQPSSHSHHVNRKHTQQEISTAQSPPSRKMYLIQLCREAGQSSSKQQKQPCTLLPGEEKGSLRSPSRASSEQIPVPLASPFSSPNNGSSTGVQFLSTAESKKEV